MERNQYLSEDSIPLLGEELSTYSTEAHAPLFVPPEPPSPPWAFTVIEPQLNLSTFFLGLRVKARSNLTNPNEKQFSQMQAGLEHSLYFGLSKIFLY